MRVTSNTSGDNSIYYLQQGMTKLNKITELIASEQNVNRPSDDPIASNLILGVANKIKAGDQYKSNIDKTTILMQVASTALQGMSDTVTLAKSLASSLINGSSDQNTLTNSVYQLKALKQQLVDMGNTTSGDSYVFAGAKSTAIPFSATSPYYSGDETAINVEISANSTQQTNIPGNQILTADTAASQPYGSVNILKTLDDLITAVGSNDVAGIKAGSLALTAGAKQIQNAQNDMATRMIRLDSSATMNTNNRNTMMTILGNTQNVDLNKLGVELTQQQTAYNASLSATAKITQLSLLDYL